jgi:hypothetical protein
MKRYREKIEETHVVENILCLLQKKFHYVVVTIKKKSQNIGFLTIQGLMEKLQVHKKRDNDIQEHVSAQALFSKHHSKER